MGAGTPETIAGDAGRQAVSIIEPPPASHAAQFASEFGQRVLLTVDTEEEFDWEGPFTRDQLYDLLVEIADSAEGFQRSIESCLKKTENDRVARVTAMSRETWDVKLEEITSVL